MRSAKRKKPCNPRAIDEYLSLNIWVDFHHALRSSPLVTMQEEMHDMQAKANQMSSGSMVESARAFRAAVAAICESDSSGARRCLCRIPVLLEIHSSEVSTMASRSVV